MDDPFEAPDDEASASDEPKKPSLLRRVLLVLGVAFVALVGASIAVGGEIDLPAWANVRGVDIPLLGDTDAIDCRLRQLDDSDRVEITIVDGDESTYDQYQWVFNNGDFVDAADLERLSSDTIISSSREGFEEQFYAVALVPDPEGRVFCGSIILR